MDKRSATYFAALTANREESSRALEGFALRGVRNSVVEKYSDQAHFIYELLQNADDAKASLARFELFRDKLIFAHNGTRRFSISDPATEKEDLENHALGDINAITAVGASNKTDTATIGKFGLGFKAVFQYTATPHIYDPDVFFKTEHLIVPIRLEGDHPSRRAGETLFVFPFDHAQRSPEDAYADISDKLRALDYPLLFLPNLKELEFAISGSLGLYEKKIEERLDFGDTTAEFVRLTQNNDADLEELHDDYLWLFSRNDDEQHAYSVGFWVGQEGQLVPKKHSAFCFFPTKRDTGLNFVVHAPFLLTDNREGIRAGDQHNLDMISLLAKLAADSLVYLRDIGQMKDAALIDDNIFEIVPYDKSGFGAVSSKDAISFLPFYTAMKEAFKGEAILPATDGYVASANAYWADVPQIAELFSNEQLAQLTQKKSAHWVFASFGRQDTLRKNKALTEYIDEIAYDHLDEDAILKGRVRGWWEDADSFKGITAAFIEAQPMEWLHRFYEWIAATKNRSELSLTMPIFLDQEGKAAAAFDKKKQAILFLPGDSDSEYRTVNAALVENADTLAFIKRIGVGEPSLEDEIYVKILPKYKEGVSIPAAKLHFRKFFQYYQTCPRNKAERFLSALRGLAFVICQSKASEEKRLAAPSELYLPSVCLSVWFAAKPSTLFVCLDEYLELLGSEQREELTDFFAALKAHNAPQILTRALSKHDAYNLKPKNMWNQPSRAHINEQNWSEHCIDGCQENISRVVTTQDCSLSVTIWNQLLIFARQGNLDTALSGRHHYFYYQRYYEEFDSREGIRLRTQPWLLDREGRFVSAGDLTIQALDPAYDVSSYEALELLQILGIKEEVREAPMAELDITSLGERLGLSEEDQRQALIQYAQKKQAEQETTPTDDSEADDPSTDCENSQEDEIAGVSRRSIHRVVKEIEKGATSAHEEPPAETDEALLDEDDYSQPVVDIGKRIEVAKKQAERDIQRIAHLEGLKQRAQEAGKYSYGWFMALLELEAMAAGESNAGSREISISFSRVERETGTSRTLVLKHPSRYIPQWMEDLSDIPLELHFAQQPMVKVAIEVVSVKSYTLRAKLSTNAQIDGVDLSQVTEAQINARSPVFLMEELRKALRRLGETNGYDDDFDMQANLCENIEFVFGPPGTGKTTHIAKNILLPLMKSTRDQKILVLTPTNKAADVLTRRIMEAAGEDQSYLGWLVRFGATADSMVEQSGVFRDKTFDIRTFARNVTVATIARFPYDYFLPDAGTRLHLHALKWDYIIIDEASMIPIANIIYPLYGKTPEKFIIAGDPFQIEPITTVDLWKNESIYTMVELNSFTSPTTVPHTYQVDLLTTQYRSVPTIGEIFSRFAYGGVLKHHRTADSQRPLPIGAFFDLKPVNLIKFPISKFESIYRPKRLQKKTPYQLYSALFAFEFVQYLSEAIDLVKDDAVLHIGVISPYRAQADLIEKLMASAVLPPGIDVQVGTIHGFQGDECDIIVALFNPPPKISTHKGMFLNKLNIVNVSISRARDYLIILMPDDETENVDNLILIKKLEQLCKEQPAWSEQLSPLIEEQMHSSRTYLEDNSFSTGHQLVNVYGLPEKRYEIRSEENAIDVQIHE